MRALAWMALVAGVLAVQLRTAEAYTFLYQYFAFSAEDLEINPGSPLSVHGRIHANGDLYLNSNPGPFSLGDNPAGGITVVEASAGGHILRGRKFDDACLGTVQIDALKDDDHDGSLDPLTLPCTGSSTSVVPEETLAAWNGTLADGRGFGIVPGPEVLARGSGLFWNYANLRIALMATTPDANGRLPIVALDASGVMDALQTARLQQFMTVEPGAVFYNDVPIAGSDAVTACATARSYCNPNSYAPAFASAARVYPCPATQIAGLYGACAAITNENLTAGGVTARRGGFFNNRENAWVRMLNLNLHDLLAWNQAQAPGNQLFDPAVGAPNGGIVIFLTVLANNADGVPNPRLGVRVLGSPGIGQNGVTVVSDQALYVEGNYNTGTLAGEPWKPAALVGDTINILSSNWESSVACHNDCQSRQPLASRPALNTSINAALVGSLDRTLVGNYNGGLENFPRMHESWVGRTLTFRGSMASLGPPLHANGAWCGTGLACNIYDPPARNWDFDAAFLDRTTLPPLSLFLSCGDGIVDPGEECDDGNALAGDCCSPTCTFEPAGNACADDGSPCSRDACDGAGSCAHTPDFAGLVCRSATGVCDAPEACDGVSPTCPEDLPAPDGSPCDDGDVCTVDACLGGTCTSAPDPCDDGNPCTRDACAPPDGCTHDASPASACRTAPTGAFQILEHAGASTSLRWSWTRGEATPLADFGTPTAAGGYALCVYDGTGPVLGIGVPGGSGWSASRNAWRYRDGMGAAGGVTSVTLASGDAGKARIVVAGRGAGLPDPDLTSGLVPPVLVQLRRSDADTCWDATYQTSDVTRNDEGRFQARRR